MGERVELHGDDPEDPHSPGGRRPVLCHGRGCGACCWVAGSAAHRGAERRTCVCGVPVLDAPVPQMVQHVVDVLKIFDRGPPEQVIEVPKVSLQDVVPLRAALCEPQLAEQLVEEPLGGGKHGLCSSSPPPGQGGMQILAAATVAEAVVDVPAIISDMLQQFFVEFVKVPQLQFIDIVVGFVVRRDRAHSAHCTEDVRFARCSSWTGWDTRCCATTGAWVHSAENCGRTASAVL